MDWGISPGILMAILAVVGLVIALRKRGKAGPQKRDELYQHLKGTGIRASLAERNDQKEKIGLGNATGKRSEGLIIIKDTDMDFINVVGVSSQYGTQYFLDYLVESPRLEGEGAAKKVKLEKKKSPPLWGKVVHLVEGYKSPR